MKPMPKALDDTFLALRSPVSSHALFAVTAAQYPETAGGADRHDQRAPAIVSIGANRIGCSNAKQALSMKF